MIKVRCQSCSKAFGIKGGTPGQRIKCPQCQAVIVVPDAAASEKPAAVIPAGPAAPPVTAVQPATVQPVAVPVSATAVQAPPQVAATPVGQPSGIPSVSTSASSTTYRRKRKSAAGTLIFCALCVVALASMGAVGYVLLVKEPDAPPQPVAVAPELAPIADATVAELTEFSQPTSLMKPATGKVTYAVTSGPTGLVIDSQSGVITWKPTEKDGPAEFDVTVSATGADAKAASSQTFHLTVTEANEAPQLQPIPDIELMAGEGLNLQAVATDADLPQQALQYALAAGAPAGATIDPESGKLIWMPGAADYGQAFPFEVQVTEAAESGLSTSAKFTVRVAKEVRPVEDLLASLQTAGAEVESLGEGASAPFSGKCHLVRIDGQQVRVIEYASAAACTTEVEQVSADGQQAFGQATPWMAPRLYRQERLIMVADGVDENLQARLDLALGKPFAVTDTPRPAPAVVKVEMPETEQVLLDLHKKRQLFRTTEYDTIRATFAQEFFAQHHDAIRQALGDDYEAMNAWWKENPAARDELFLAIQLKYDDLAGVLQIFNELRKQFPQQIAPYANLGIATALVWDKNGKGVYDYANHARRTGSTMPDGLLDAMANFKYFVDTKDVMQGRAQFLPWEFLVHVVNHKTPEPERQWALANYLGKRVMFGECYRDVPYDYEMLDTNSAVCRLNGKAYTLPNLQQFGGVCAMQADFASRVGKSLGVPAEYVNGESAFGESHAWVMWVELKAVSQSSIAFSLESYGRYRLDKYYVGKLRNPQTGEGMTDRELELGLHTVGVNAAAKRQSDLIMQAYPDLREKLELDLPGQLDFLEEVIKLCPWNESAWYAVAEVASGDDVEKKHHKQLQRVVDGHFRTFAAFPDFTWKTFDDLIAFVETPEKRNQLYQKLVELYAAAGRPDLACEAQLRLADYFVESDKAADAIKGLSSTIIAFPDEGRYVPRMLDKLETVCNDVNGANQQLASFYKAFLPLVPQKRGSRPSEYCIKMYERGIVRFQQAGVVDLATYYDLELNKLRGGRN